MKSRSSMESGSFKPMEDHRQQEVFSPSLPVLSRLDRLDRLLVLLEERQCMSTRRSSSPTVIKTIKGEQDLDKCKTLSSALEEVNHKGTLMERLTMLENRVLELSVEMEAVGNTSRSSPSTIQNMAENIIEHYSPSSTVRRQDDEDLIINNFQVVTTNSVEAGASACDRKSKDCPKDKRGRSVKTMRLKKWPGWFRMGC